MKLTIPGEPVPQARPRFTRTGIAYTLDKCKEYRKWVNTVGHSFMAENNLQPLDYALCVNIKVYRSVPKSWNKKRHSEALSGLLRPSVKPDIDNYVKAVLDGLNGIVWVDDNLIVSLTAEKYYSDNPRVEIEVEVLF